MDPRSDDTADKQGARLMVVVLVTTAFMCVGSIGGAGWFAWRAAQNAVDRAREAEDNERIAAIEAARAQARANYALVGQLLGDAVAGDGLPQDIHDKNGKPLLSWRVLLLRQKGGDAELFKQFKLNEPWDGPNNRPLIARMPAMYAPPPAFAGDPGSTYMRGFSHEGAAFGPPHRELTTRSRSEFTAGLGEVLTVFEARSPIEWTRPDELTWPEGAERPSFPGFGGTAGDRFHFRAITADGRVHEVRTTIPDENLRPLFDMRKEKRGGARLNMDLQR